MQLNAVVAPKSKGEPLPLMLIFQGPVPVADNDQWPHTSGFPAFLESNSCGSNYGAVIIKHYHFALNPWLHTINVSASIKKKALLIFDGCPIAPEYLSAKGAWVVWYGGLALQDKHLTRDQHGGSGEFWYRKDRISKG